MANVTDYVRDERMARIMLSMMAAPDDPMTGKVVSSVGGTETLRLLDSDHGVPLLNNTEAKVWRARLAPLLGLGVLTRADEYEELGLHTLIPTDDYWPKSLSDLGPRQPYVLWVHGAASLLSGPVSDRVTITGSRAAAHYGEHVTSSLATDLSSEERIIVGGGDYGIEGAAHRWTLAAGGHTIAVLAGGIDQRYPSSHAALLDAIGDVGLLVTELPPGIPPKQPYFLARHRLMAAISGATVVVEASTGSGASNIAREAAALGRAVGAVPGPVTSATSSGTNTMLRNGSAAVITQASDALNLLDGRPASTPQPDQMSPISSADPQLSTNTPRRLPSAWVL